MLLAISLQKPIRSKCPQKSLPFSEYSQLRPYADKTRRYIKEQNFPVYIARCSPESPVVGASEFARAPPKTAAVAFRPSAGLLANVLNIHGPE